MVVSASLLILVITWLAQGAAAALPSKMKEYHSPGYALILAREKIRIQNPKYGLY